MRKILFLSALIILGTSCENTTTNSGVIVNNAEELNNAISNAKPGDEIIMANGKWNDIEIRFTGKGTEQQPITLRAETPGEVIQGKSDLKLGGEYLVVDGLYFTNGSSPSQAVIEFSINNSLYNLTLENSEISDFDFVLKAYKDSFSEYIKLNGTTIHNCNNGLELAAEIDDHGDYNAENVLIINCRFDGIDKNVIDYYRGGYDESTVGGNLVVSNSTFVNCGAKEENGILLNTYGIINVDISGNKFQNNRVKLIAKLWGAKNNSHSDNVIENSGKIIVEQNLELKLLY